VITFRVTVPPSAKIDPAARAAVASILQGVGGELRIKMHDKIPAIDKLARMLGMYRVKVDVSHAFAGTCPEFMGEASSS
jgi:hypothetical protein